MLIIRQQDSFERRASLDRVHRKLEEAWLSCAVAILHDAGNQHQLLPCGQLNNNIIIYSCGSHFLLFPTATFEHCSWPNVIIRKARGKHCWNHYSSQSHDKEVRQTNTPYQILLHIQIHLYCTEHVYSRIKIATSALNQSWAASGRGPVRKIYSHWWLDIKPFSMVIIHLSKLHLRLHDLSGSERGS